MNSAYQLGHWVLPEAALLPLAVLLSIVGFALWAIGLRKIGRAILFAGVAFVVLPVLLEPVLNEIFAHVPAWVVLVVFAALVFYVVRLFLTLFLGKEGAGTLMAMGVARGFVGLFRLPGNLVRWSKALRRLLNSPDPKRRALGMAIAIALAAATGAAGRQVTDAWQATSVDSQAASVDISSYLDDPNGGTGSYPD